MYTLATGSRYRIRNTIFTDNVFGLYLNTAAGRGHRRPPQPLRGEQPAGRRQRHEHLCRLGLAEHPDRGEPLHPQQRRDRELRRQLTPERDPGPDRDQPQRLHRRELDGARRRRRRHRQRQPLRRRRVRRRQRVRRQQRRRDHRQHDPRQGARRRPRPRSVRRSGRCRGMRVSGEFDHRVRAGRHPRAAGRDARQPRRDRQPHRRQRRRGRSSTKTATR